MTPVELPKANENLTEATLDRWLAPEGATVSEKQPLCVIITDKATFELPSPAAGVVRRIYQAQRAVLPVGYILCALGAADEPVPGDYDEHNRQVLESHRAATVSVGPSQTVDAAVALGGEAVRASPAARRLAKEAGVSPAEVAKALGLTRPLGEKDVKLFLEQRGVRAPEAGPARAE
jgi:2-oxoglutarate dehydrogenase E2 component (dihydrolipoamide succinyltransferase)